MFSAKSSQNPRLKPVSVDDVTVPIAEALGALADISIGAGQGTNVERMLAKAELWDPSRDDATVIAELRKSAQADSLKNFREALRLTEKLVGTSEQEHVSWSRAARAAISGLMGDAASPGVDTVDATEVVGRIHRQIQHEHNTESLPARVSALLLDFAQLKQILFDAGRASREERALTVLRRLNVSVDRMRESLVEGDANLGTINSIAGSIRGIWQSQCVVKAASDMPRIMADGLMRTKIYTMQPEALRARQLEANWPQKDGDPVADMVIVGGGPGGLSAAYHAGRIGLKTVLFEGGFFGQAFSDARAKAVHAMRTNTIGSSLFRPGIVPAEVCDEVGLTAVMESSGLRRHAEEARVACEERTGRRFIGALPGSKDAGNRDVPITRGELYHYLLHVAEQTFRFPDVALVEQAPVNVVRKRDDGLWEIETAGGHKQLARKLVMATGFVGSEGQHARRISDLADLCDRHGDKYLTLNDEDDIVRLNDQILSHIQDLRRERQGGPAATRQVIMSDVVLGHQEGQLLLGLLTAGRRVAVVGSGESAAKAALEVLAQNPRISVMLFVKSPLEPAQSQTPPSPGNADTMGPGIFCSELGKTLMSRWMDTFGTPITPATMLDLLRATQQGRLRLFELGTHFSEKCLDIRCVETDARSQTRISIDPADSAVRPNLARQLREWHDCGFMTSVSSLVDEQGHLADVDCIVTAPGYDRNRLRVLDPLTKQLLDQGLISLVEEGGKGRSGEIELDGQNRLTSKMDPTLAVIGAGNMASASDGGLAGIGARAYFTVEFMAAALSKAEDAGVSILKARLAAREAAAALLQSPPSPNDALIKSLADGSVQDDARASKIASERFASVPLLIALEARRLSGKPLDPVERLVLMRGQALMTKVWQMDSALAARGSIQGMVDRLESVPPSDVSR